MAAIVAKEMKEMKEMKERKVSIIIPVYNSELYLRKCLDSLVEQTLIEIEIICVNDGSTDHSYEIIQKYAKSDERFLILNQEKAGVSATRNAGLKIAQGQFLMFVDSDDWVDANICKTLYEVAIAEQADSAMCSYTKEFENHSSQNHIFPEQYLVLERDDFKNRFYRRLFGLYKEELRYPEYGDLVVSPCMQLFRKEICEKVEFMDLKEIGTSEDAFFQMMVYSNCNKMVYIDKPYYHYRKTNKKSITSVYKPELFEQWQRLFSVMDSIICQNISGGGTNRISAGFR